MLTRIITGAVSIGIFVPVCIFSDTMAFPIVIGLLCFIGVYEMAKCLGFDKNYFITIPMYIVALALPMIRHSKYDILFNTNTPYLAFAMIILFGLLIYILAYVMFKKNTVKLSEILTFYAMYVYIIGCFISMVLVRYSAAYLGTDGSAIDGVYV